jgi:hypothetical protein
MKIRKYILYFILSGILIRLIFTSSVIQFAIVLSVFFAGIYFLLKKQIFWKIYAYVLALITIAGTLYSIFVEFEASNSLSIFTT